MFAGIVGAGFMPAQYIHNGWFAPGLMTEMMVINGQLSVISQQPTANSQQPIANIHHAS
jgi:hypothetical protein